MKFHNPLKKTIKSREEREKDIDALNKEIEEKEKVIAQLEHKKQLQDKLKSLKKNEKELLFPSKIRLKNFNTSGLGNVMKKFENINAKMDTVSTILMGDTFKPKPKPEENPE